MSLDNKLALLSNPKTLKVAQILTEMEDSSITEDQLKEKALGKSSQGGLEERRFHISLYQSIIPKMEDHGLVEHDKRSETLRYWEDEELEEVVGLLTPSSSEYFNLLSSPEKRETAYVLMDMDEEHISRERLERRLDRRGEGSYAGKEMATWLHHVALPKMEDHDILEYDRQAQTVHYQGDESFEELVNYVRDMDLRDCTF